MYRFIIHNAARTNMNYKLNKPSDKEHKGSFDVAIKRLMPLLVGERKNLVIAFVAIIITSGASLLAPAIISYTIDTFIKTKDYGGVLRFAGILAVIYTTGLITSYIQTLRMGGVGRRVLFRLRNQIFTKLQDLPVAFFNQNKAGDLISRINNDTDKLNQFFFPGPDAVHWERFRYFWCRNISPGFQYPARCSGIIACIGCIDRDQVNLGVGEA